MPNESGSCSAAGLDVPGSSEGSLEKREPSGKLSLEASRQQPIPHGSQSGGARGCFACGHDRFGFTHVRQALRLDGWLC